MRVLILEVLVVIFLSALAVLRFQTMFVDPWMHPEIPFSTCRFSTGDLVLVDANLGSALLSGPWSHCAMVFSPPHKEPFLVDIVPSGVRARPLEQSIKEVLGHSHWSVAVRPVRRRISWKRARRALKKVSAVRYGHTYWSTWLNRYLQIFPRAIRGHKGGTFCSEFVLQLAWTLGLMGEEEALPSDMVVETWHPETWGPAKLIR